jgi:prophage regulatory protein
MQTIPTSTSGLLREKHVLKLVPVAHSTLWNWVRDKKFPAPIKLSEKVSVWKKDDVSAWIEAKFSEGECCDSSPEHIDQLGYNGGPPLDDAVGLSDPPIIKVERKKRGDKNG